MTWRGIVEDVTPNVMRSRTQEMCASDREQQQPGDTWGAQGAWLWLRSVPSVSAPEGTPEGSSLIGDSSGKSRSSSWRMWMAGAGEDTHLRVGGWCCLVL